MKSLLLALLSTIGVALAVAGVVVFMVGLWRMRQAARTRRWPTVQGTVLSSTTASRQGPPPPPLASEDADAERPPQTLYRPLVKYTYTVGSRTYTSETLGPDDVEHSSERLAREHAARYAPSAPVTVYYDPNDPGRAYLEPGIHAVSWLLPAISLVFLLVSGAVYAFVRWYSGR
jgi:hypothetical protein